MTVLYRCTVYNSYIRRLINDSQQSHQNAIPSVNEPENNTQQHNIEHQSNSTSNSPFPPKNRWNNSLVTKLKESQSKERKANNPPTTHPTTSKTNDSNSKANKPTQPLTKKPKRSNSIEQIILKLDESLAAAKLDFEKMPNLKIDFNQLKYIIENTLSIQDPSSVLKEFNISWMEIIENLDTIRPKVKNLSIKNRLSRLSNSLLDITLARLSRLNKDKNSDVNDEITKLTNENAATPIKIIHREINNTPLPWDYSYLINTELNSLSKQNTSPEIFRSHVYNILDDFKDHQKIYTDASKGNEGVGIAIALENTNITFKLPNECSIFSAEAIAILKAIETIQTTKHTKFVILSDSLSAIKNIQNKNNPNDISVLIQNQLDEAKTNKKQISIIWIPGHTGIAGNEIADKYAILAASNKNTTKLNISSYYDIKKAVKTQIRKKWHLLWNDQETKLNQIKRTTFSWENHEFNRKEETTINRLRIGHSRLTHGYLMSKEEPPTCEGCGTLINIKHILTECQLHQQERINLNITETLDSLLGPDPVFESVIKWVKKDLDQRKDFLIELMEHVRLPIIASRPDILLNLVNEPLLKDNLKCYGYVVEALSFNIQKSVQYFTIPQTIRCKPRQFGDSHKVILMFNLSDTSPKCYTEWYDPATKLREKAPGINYCRFTAGLGVIRDQFVFAVGGVNSSYSPSVSMLDVSSQSPSWVPMADMVVERGRLGVGVFDDCIYAVGGGDEHNSLNSVEVFDASIQKWRLVASMSTKRCDLGVGVLNNRLYAVGGADDEYHCLKSVECYDPTLDTWTPVAEMSVRRHGVGLGVLDGLLYAIGGYGNKKYLKSVEVYRPSDGVWSSVADMEICRFCPGVAVLDGLLYVMGGKYDQSIFSDTVEIYNPKTNTWTMERFSRSGVYIYGGVVVDRPPNVIN
eukprot:XP_008190141.1 PREDICTED: uncharacterized protein LOC100572585 [Acyrthosiphon pisum]